jgi:hypothetical protein
LFSHPSVSQPHDPGHPDVPISFDQLGQAFAALVPQFAEADFRASIQ